MKCPVCQSEMHQSNVGFLCMNCGHVESEDGGRRTEDGSQKSEIGDQTTESPKPAPSKVEGPDTPEASPNALTPEELKSAIGEPKSDPISDLGSPTSELVVDHLHTENPVVENRHQKAVVPWKRIAIGSAVLVLIAALGGALYYYAVYQPPRILTEAAQKLAASKSAKMAGTVTFNSDDPKLASAKIDLAFKGAFDLHQGEPRLLVDLSGTIAGAETGAHAVVADKSLFLKLDTIGFLGSIGSKLTADWYKLPLNSAKTDCVNVSNFHIAVTGAKLVGLESVSGHRSLHYRGNVDLAKLPTTIAQINRKLSADCKISLDPKLYQDLRIGYDLWAGGSFDRLRLVISNPKDRYRLTLTTDSSNYNDQQPISAPTGAREVKDISTALLGNAADNQRKSDLGSVKAALEKYYTDKKFYPAGDYSGLKTTLVPTYVAALPTDPAGGSYVYTPSKCNKDPKKGCTAFELKATLEDKTDSSYPAYKLTGSH